MIIFGTRGVTYSAGAGSFFCPNCRSEGDYKQKRVRRFFALYFVPLIPLDLHGEYVECGRCRGTYNPEVLDFDPAVRQARFEAEFHRAIKLVMVEMMLADGHVDDEEIAVIKRIYAQLAGNEITESDIRAEIVEAETRSRDVTAALNPIAGNLNNDGKEMVVKAAFLVAAADGVFQDEEKALISSIAQSLEMSTAHLNGVIHSMVQEQ